MPDFCYSKSDAIYFFFEKPQNKFIDNKTNTLFETFIKDLGKLSSLYSNCWRCDPVGNGDHKLVCKKDGSPEEHELINQSVILSNQLSNSFSIFRQRIKNELHV